jgi:hypothetical protein
MADQIPKIQPIAPTTSTVAMTDETKIVDFPNINIPSGNVSDLFVPEHENSDVKSVPAMVECKLFDTVIKENRVAQQNVRTMFARKMRNNVRTKTKLKPTDLQMPTMDGSIPIPDFLKNQIDNAKFL